MPGSASGESVIFTVLPSAGISTATPGRLVQTFQSAETLPVIVTSAVEPAAAPRGTNDLTSGGAADNGVTESAASARTTGLSFRWIKSSIKISAVKACRNRFPVCQFVTSGVSA